MKISEELLWDFVANRVTPEEAAFIETVMQKDTALAVEINRIRHAHMTIISNVTENLEKSTAGLTGRILQRVNALETAKQPVRKNADNRLMLLLFAPFALIVTGYFILYFEEMTFQPLPIDPIVPGMVAAIVLVLLFSFFVARYILYKINSRI